MGVDTAPSYLVSSRFREISLSESCQKRADHHDGSPQGSAFPDKVIACYVVRVYVIGLEYVFPSFHACHFHTHPFQKDYQVPDIEDFRNIGYCDLLICKQAGADDLKRLVLCALRPYHTAQFMAAFYNKIHFSSGLYSFLMSGTCQTCSTSGESSIPNFSRTDETILFSNAMIFLKRSNVSWSKERPVPKKSRNCLGSVLRLKGQKRLPMPPPIMTQ